MVDITGLSLEKLEEMVNEYVASVYYKHVKYKDFKRVYGFYSSLRYNAITNGNAKLTRLANELGRALASSTVNFAGYASLFRTNTDKLMLKVFRKRLEEDLEWSALEESVYERTTVLDNNEVVYPLWLVYYFQYKSLMEREINIGNDKYHQYVSMLGRSLVDARVHCLIPEEENPLKEFKNDIKKDLGRSNKLVID